MGKVVYNQGDGIIEIILRDESGRKQECMKANNKDHKTQAEISRKLMEKWDIRLIPEGFVESKGEGLFEF